MKLRKGGQRKQKDSLRGDIRVKQWEMGKKNKRSLPCKYLVSVNSESPFVKGALVGWNSPKVADS